MVEGREGGGADDKKALLCNGCFGVRGGRVACLYSEGCFSFLVFIDWNAPMFHDL